MTAKQPLPPPPDPPGYQEFTNTGARLLIFMARQGKRRRVLRIVPGETVSVSPAFAKVIVGSPVHRAGGIQEGRVKMPPGRVPDLSRAEPAVCLRVISSETNLATVQRWAATEKRGDVLMALTLRAKELAA